jgi:pimeloyl-ACP methyl ester carboxylesterase
VAVATAQAPSARRDPDEWRGIDWRGHQRWVHAGGRAVNLVDIGEGPAVVLVHGLGSNWQCWLRNIPALAERHRVIALDLPGFGHSEMPAEDISIKGFAECVGTVLDTLGVDRAAVVGNSMGGFIGTEMALARPERVDRLVLVSAAALWNERRRARPLVVLSKLTSAYAAKIAAQWQLAHEHPRLRGPALRSAGIRYPGRLPADFAFEIMQASGAPGFPGALQALYDYRIRDRLEEVAAPTLVVWGTHDPLVPLAHAFEYEALVPRARVVVFRDTGHVPMLEEPERFNRTLEDFLGEEELAGSEEPAAEVR